MAHKIDTETNMPEVSGNLFWRVERFSDMFGDVVMVALMERREKLWGIQRKPRQVYHKYVQASTATVYEIQQVAIEVIEGHAHNIQLRQMLGDYPPKKLPI